MEKMVYTDKWLKEVKSNLELATGKRKMVILSSLFLMTLNRTSIFTVYYSTVESLGKEVERFADERFKKQAEQKRILDEYSRSSSCSISGCGDKSWRDFSKE